MTAKEVKNYVMNTPGNTNPAVLTSMLSQISGSGMPTVEGSGKALVSVNGEWKEQDGYGYTEIGEEVLTDETIETSEQYGMICGNFEEPFTIEEETEYTIWFNGTKYVLNSSYSEGYMMAVIGDFNDDEEKFDFSRYPFGIGEFGDGLVLVTESEGTYDIEVSVGGTEVVHKIDSKYLPSGGVMAVNFSITGNNSFTADKTPEEIISAFSQGVFVYGIVMNSMPVTLAAADNNDGDYIVQFGASAVISDDEIQFVTLRWNNNDGSWDYANKYITVGG